MTTFGWDASHYDGVITPAIAVRARAEGIEFFTHKIGEGTGGDDSTDSTALAAFRDAGVEVIGGYHVVRSGPVAAQVDALIALADRDEPWWRTFPGWCWQADLERWPIDDVPAQTGIDFGILLAQRTKRTVLLYASRGQYGNQLGGWPGMLWNAAYGTTGSHPGPFKALYPGDDAAAWAPYSGKTPTLLQYTSSATIAGLTTCDANAFRGTIGQLKSLISGGYAMGVLGADDKAWLVDELHDKIRWGTATPSIVPPGGYPAPSLQTIHERMAALDNKVNKLIEMVAQIGTGEGTGDGLTDAEVAEVASVVRAELDATKLTKA